ncbi:MAG: threonine dehydratase [Alphaproteobacteria bacterium]|nr:threonine dehydratase [Alphaproteobacteria bacterium]
MKLLTKENIEDAQKYIYRHMPPTPQYVWPQICENAGTTVWIKHENHTPTGAFKVRGGITFMDWLKRTHPQTKGIITATRGNHGQSQARAATAAGLTAKIVVPSGNSHEKNTAMRSFGAEIIEHGEDFSAAAGHAKTLAAQEDLFPVPAFHSEIIRGVSTYALELFTAAPDLDAVYVPIGCGSGICGLIAARDALNLKTKIIGVVSTEAQAAKISFESGRPTETQSAKTFADGMAVRIPVKEALDIYAQGAEKIIAVTDDEIAAAVRLLYQTTHNVAEGAGAAALAALMKERETMKGKKVAAILSGGNIDADLFTTILKGQTPPA